MRVPPRFTTSCSRKFLIKGDHIDDNFACRYKREVRRWLGLDFRQQQEQEELWGDGGRRQAIQEKEKSKVGEARRCSKEQTIGKEQIGSQTRQEDSEESCSQADHQVGGQAGKKSEEEGQAIVLASV